MLFNTKDLSCQPLLPNETYSARVFQQEHSAIQALEEIPELKMGDLCEWVTKGRWSAHQLTERLLEQTGPADVMLATWAITRKPLEKLNQLKRQEKIRELHGLFESKIATYNSKGYGYALQFFDSVWLAKCHAKVTVITNEDWAISIIASANWSVNRRIEAGVIMCSRESAQFHRNWMLNEQKNEQSH